MAELTIGFLEQLERFSLPMFCFFRMECRRWAPMCREWLVLFSTSLIFRGFLVLAWTVGLTGWAWLSGYCRDAGEFRREAFQ